MGMSACGAKQTFGLALPQGSPKIHRSSSYANKSGVSVPRPFPLYWQVNVSGLFNEQLVITGIMVGGFLS